MAEFYESWTDRVRVAASGGYQRAAAARNPEVVPEHILAELLEDPDGLAGPLLGAAGSDPDAVHATLLERLAKLPTSDADPVTSTETQEGLSAADQLRRDMDDDYLSAEHLMLVWAQKLGTTRDKLFEALRELRGSRRVTTPDPEDELAGLERFGRDLTAAAALGELDPAIGRGEEVLEVIRTLGRKTKANPVLIGEPGVGKTAIVEELARRIVAGTVPRALRRARVFELDLGALTAGTSLRGEFEARMKKVMEMLAESGGNVILFVDELHTLMGAGRGEGAPNDAAQMLKPALARGRMRLIGATTTAEYRTIEKDAAFERRLAPITVNPPTVKDTITILQGLRPAYEDHHDVSITDAALEAAARLSDRYIADRQLPDKAIDLLDAAAAALVVATEVSGHDGPRPTVGVDDIAGVASRKTGIPTTKLTATESTKLLTLEAELHQRVIGQDQAVSAVAGAIRRSRAGLSDPSRPAGAFLFTGPTGVGKTELAKALAVALFDDEHAMVRIDMSEYGDTSSTSRLTGAAPGYVGYEEGGQLTEAVRRRPYSVVLFDEIEKAHPDVLTGLLQVLDDGRLTDSQGRTVNFSNTIALATSNVPEEQLAQRFRPEFVNRLTVVGFDRLGLDDIGVIVELQLQGLAGRLAEQGLGLAVTTAAREWLAETGYDPEYGARPIRRLIETEVAERIAVGLLEERWQPGDTITVDVDDDEISCRSGSAPTGATRGPGPMPPAPSVAQARTRPRCERPLR